MKSQNKFAVTCVARMVVSVIMAVMMMLPNVTVVRATQPQPQSNENTPLSQSDNECPQDGNSCFSTDGIKVSSILVTDSGEVQIRGHLGFTATIQYQATAAGGVQELGAGDFSETFGPFDLEDIFAFDIREGSPDNPGSQRFPNYMDGGTYVEEFGYRVYVEEGPQPLDVGQGAYDWESQSGDAIFVSFMLGYSRNFSEGRDLGTPKHKPGSPHGAAVHEWGGHMVQDFTGTGGDVNNVVMIYNHNRCRTYAVSRHKIMMTYLNNGGPGGWLGAPVTDEYNYGDDDPFEYLYVGFYDWWSETWPLQRFEHGFISTTDGEAYPAERYYPTGGNIDLYVYTTDEGKGRVYMSLNVVSVPGLPDDEPLNVYIAGSGEGDIWPMELLPNGRYYGAYGYDFDFGDTAQLSIQMWRQGDGAQGFAPRDRYTITIPIERGYERNGIDPFPSDLISDIDCSDPEGGGGGHWCPGPPELIITDENGQSQPWDYIVPETLYLQFSNVPNSSSFMGMVRSRNTGKETEVTFSSAGACLHTATVPEEDILTNEAQEVVVFAWSDSSTDFGRELLELDGVVDRGLAAGNGNEQSHIPPASEAVFQSGGFETIIVSALDAEKYTFMRNQADLVLYMGHGSHALGVPLIYGCPNEPDSWNNKDECTLSPDEIGNTWDIDVDDVLLFACSILDIEDKNGYFNDDNVNGNEVGPTDQGVVWPGQNWVKHVPGPMSWLGFNAEAPEINKDEHDDNDFQNGGRIIREWLSNWVTSPASSIRFWKETTLKYIDNAPNACTINNWGSGSIDYSYYKHWNELNDPLDIFTYGMKIWITDYDVPVPNRIYGLTEHILTSSGLDESPSIDIIMDGAADLHVWDLQGRHVGPTETGIDQEIPGSSYEVVETGEVLIEIVGADLSLGYTMRVIPTGQDEIDIGIRIPDVIKSHLRSVQFLGLNAAPDNIFELVLDRETAHVLLADYDGDGVFEEEIQPSTVWRPRIADTPYLHVCADRGNQQWVISSPELILENKNPNATGMQINFSNEWQDYTESIALTTEGRLDFSYRSILGDQPGMVQMASIQIDTTYPESLALITPTLPLDNNGNYNSDVSISVIGTDPGINASGLSYVDCQLNGNGWQPCETLIVDQNGTNVFEYRAVDVAGNTEPEHRMTITLDKTVHTLIRLDEPQTDLTAAIRAGISAFLDGQLPLMATEAFSLPLSDGMSSTFPAGTLILEGNLTGDFDRYIHIGPLDMPSVQVLYSQFPAIFNSASDDERASWEQLEIGIVLEDQLNLPDWPRVDEYTLVSDTVASDVLFIPAGVTPDVQRLFAESGAADALFAQVQSGRWIVCQGDGCLLVQQARLVPPGTVGADATFPTGSSTLIPAADTLLTYNWPAEMELTRYSDTPRFTLSGDLVRVADYSDNGEAAIVMQQVGQGGVILIGGHASADASSYGLLYHALFTAGAEQVSSQIEVKQQYMPGTPQDVVPGLELDIPVLVRTEPFNYGATVQDFQHTEFIAAGFRLLDAPTVTSGTIVTAPATTPQGTWITWTVEALSPGAHEMTYRVANVTTDTLKSGEVTIGEALFRYTTVDAVTQTVQLRRADAVVRAMLSALVTHNFTDEPDNVYPLPPEGVYIHVRHDLENKLETRANNLAYTVTVPFFDIVRDAYDQTIFPYIEGTQENVWVINEVSGYPGRDYLVPRGAADDYWYYVFEDWDCHTWVRISNPRHIPISIPPEMQAFAYQEANNGDIWVAGKILVFDLGTMLSYDQREPAIRYMIWSEEFRGRGISFSVEPVTGTVVLEGNGGSVYTAAGQHPIPFREYFPDAAINNPIAPTPSEITYTDLWGRVHTVTESVRSSYYDIIPYPKTGDAVSVRAVDVYGIEGERADRLYDVAAAQTLTVTYVLRAASVNRSLAQEQFLIQKFLPRGLGYDIEFLSWESSNGSFVLLDEYSLQYPAFELLSFQGALPENTPQVLTITARLRTYPEHVREGSFLVDGGSRYVAPVEIPVPGHYDTGMTHVRVEQGYAANPEIIKRVAEAQVPRHGGTAHEIINLNALADIQRYREETYVDSVGTLDKAATVRVGGSWGPNLYFATVTPGGETLLVYEIVNAEGQDWSDVTLNYVAPPGITLTPIFTDGVEPPPNVYDTPYLWATEIPDIGRGVYYYKVHVDASVAPGVMYPIIFTLTGDNVPDAAAFPLPAARVGVGGDARYILGQTTAEQVIDLSPDYVTPVAAAVATAAQMATTTEYTTTEEWAAFFAALTTTVPFTYTVQPGGARLITYTIPAAWQTLPQQNGTALTGEWTLLVQSAITATEPGYRVVNYGPQLEGVDGFDYPLVVLGNPGYTTVSGPALTGTYTLLTVTSPFYGDMVIDPLPGEVVDAWIDIATTNRGNRPALSPVISATINLTGGVEILDIIPAPISVISGVITWQLEDPILPYGGSGDPELDTAHTRVQVRFTPPDTEQIRARLARLETTPFYVPLLEQSHARYDYTWGEQTFTIHSPLGAEYGLRVGADPLPAPTLIRATWDAASRRVLLEWTEIAGARDYVVYRSTQPDCDFYQVGPVTSGATMENHIADDPLSPVYYYVVRARSVALAEGRHSSVVAVFTARSFEVYLPLVLRQ